MQKFKKNISNGKRATYHICTRRHSNLIHLFIDIKTTGNQSISCRKNTKGMHNLSNCAYLLCFFSNSTTILISFVQYSHLSNKRGPTLTDFEKFHPPQNKNPLYRFTDFSDFSTLHSTFIRFMY